MILTRFSVPRSFVDTIGFTEAIRAAARVPTDPELIRIFQKLAPHFDWYAAQAKSALYVPPRWLGYWSSNGCYWASDGLFKLLIARPEALIEVIRLVRETHYAGQSTGRFVAVNGREPSHMLLHDSENQRLYVAPFEHAEATLVKQPRVA